ncbi:MmpS family transport accessory protein [Mycolicibacterium fallax]|uniref:Membrane protein, MmpS n=1 Tax=Mycolicibacterium fallax TaxID=1793 RepID=A0A1X1RH21_MYCFA|nr:MmpS family transport accessory protein [Mycolicibacterium fallax]ORV05590.1 hypothetical protein AWC04_06405 [Mycolicibacterium fallax]HOW94130.1 MmpS family transport accessory protein [Mycolicibacterium fallax]HSA39509.1 MmpS family transport accessory protein [Mycobacterium sp.]
MLAIIKRMWIPLVVLIAVALGTTGVLQLRGKFGSDEIFAVGNKTVETIVPFNPKEVTYELFGPASASGRVSYLNADAQPEEAVFNGLPWTHSFSTTIPAVVANLVAQGDVGQLGCRITVNGTVKDEQTVTGPAAQAFCLVKAA